MQRRQSLLGGGGGSPIGGAGSGSNSGSASDVEREEAARAETMALLDDLKARLAAAESASDTNKRQAEVLQSRLDDALAEQAKLEERAHEAEEHVELLTNAKREAARQMREMEAIYEAERSAMAREKEDMANREEDMQTVIQRLKDSLAQRTSGDDEGRPSRHSAATSPSLDSGSFAPPSSVQRSDSRNASKLLLQKDRLIEQLRLELAEAQIKLVEAENKGGGRLQEVERQLMETRMANARLMEDNESYQLLLSEKTLKGDFGTHDFSYMSSSANQDALAALEGRNSTSAAGEHTGPTSLADELSFLDTGDAPEAGDQAEGGASGAVAVSDPAQRRAEAEIKTLKDQNKALSLYINKIIERLLSHQEFEKVLDQANDMKSPNTDKALPPPPPKTASAQTGPSLLQRAKTMVVGEQQQQQQAVKPKPRPLTFTPSAEHSALTNPDTAPSIPIGPPIGMGRSGSTRRAPGRPMSDQFTTSASGGGGPGGSAASIVNAMYRGSTHEGGPLSPTLRGSSGQAFNFAGSRASSGSVIGARNSETSSVASGIGGGDEAHPHPHHHHQRHASSATATTAAGQSPPRSEAGSSVSGSGGGKTTTFAGNKPRPLRLVQENAEAAAAAAAAARRQSWMGWASTAFTAAGAKKEDVAP